MAQGQGDGVRVGLQGGLGCRRGQDRGKGLWKGSSSRRHLSVGNHRRFYLMVTLRKNLPVWSRMLRYREKPPCPEVLT